MVMGAETGAGMVETAGHLALDAKGTGHSEMHDERFAVIEIGNKIFGAPTEAGDGTAGQSPRKILRKSKAQVRSPHLDLVKALAKHGGRQSSAHGLDFR
ncbi:hypothetical protein GCM10007276_03360 [Agaricicola taiwanensis]|uniref:Uncharacterized protein n=1 Tax=Agaricicola taiwanensis TaxID=591372 RepID=A0A8J2VK00_9RHOB|nr:hypothetical protein GCM10007276_03360 [Agaricicola taiwanensis]